MVLHINIYNIVTNFLRSYRIHVIIWSVFLLYEILIAAAMSGRVGTFTNYVIHYTINISLFYFHGAYILPKVFKKENGAYWILVLSVLMEALIYVYVVYQLDIYLLEHTDILGKASIPPSNLLARITWRGIYFLLFGTGYYFFIAYLSARTFKEEMEKEKLLNTIQQEKMAKDLMIAKNAYLKAQINPHFLFNTLDFVYHDIVQHSPKSGESVLALAEIMRYALDVEYYGEYVTVGNELVQLEKFIELRRLTNDGQKLINLCYEEEVKSVKIIPLVILTLAENMFKHGDLREVAGTLHVSKISDRLHITTINSIGNEQQTTGFGSGLSNIKERLWDAYKEKAQLTPTTESNCFKVEVSIRANE